MALVDAIQAISAVPQPAAPQTALGGANFASGSDSNTVGTGVLMFRVPVADGADGDIDTLITTAAIRVVDAWRVKTGGASGGVNTAQVQTVAGVAVTSLMGGNVADQVLNRPTTIDDATHNFAAGATIRIRRVRAAGNSECVVFIMAVRT